MDFLYLVASRSFLQICFSPHTVIYDEQSHPATVSTRVSHQQINSDNIPNSSSVRIRRLPRFGRFGFVGKSSLLVANPSPRLNRDTRLRTVPGDTPEETATSSEVIPCSKTNLTLFFLARGISTVSTKFSSIPAPRVRLNF